MTTVFFDYDTLTDEQIGQMFDREHTDAVAVRHLTVADLPDGDLKAKLIPYLHSPSEAKVFIVAKPGMVRDWAAYHSPPNLGAISAQGIEWLGGQELAHVRCVLHYSPYRTMTNGDKLTAADATALFPRIAVYAERYRP